MDKSNEIVVQEFAHLVTTASRFLFGLANIPMFRDGEVGLAEWVALSLLAETGSITNKQLTKRLGISGQRLSQIRQSLVAANLIEISRPRDTATPNLITITAAGLNVLSELNAKLLPVISTAIDGKEHLFANSQKALAGLMRIVNEARPTKEEPDAAAK